MKNWISVLVVSMCLGVMLCGCGQSPVDNSKDKTYSTVHHYFGTQSPGDAWDWTTENYTFSGSNEMTGLYFSGLYSITSNGYMKATIESTSDNVNMPTGTIIYGLEIPGTMLIIKPGINDNMNRVIICAAKANSAYVGKFNWVVMPGAYWDNFGPSPAYGTGEIVSQLDNTYTDYATGNYIDGSFAASWQTDGMIFDNGLFYEPGEDFKTCIMESGIGVSDCGANSNSIINLGDPNTEISSVDVAADLDYRGVIYYTNAVGATSTAETKLIGARKDPSREGALQIYNWAGNNFEDGSPDYTNCITLELGSNINNGILKGKYIDSNGATPNSEVIISKIDNKYIVFGISTLPISNYPVNVVLIQR